MSKAFSKGNKLTVKQERFIQEYIKSGNATQSAIKAGYSKATANRIGSENLTKLDNEIQSRLQRRDKRKVAQADEVLELLTKLARGEMNEEQIVVEGNGNGYSKARIMNRKIANKDQLQALDKLAKIHGLFTERVQISVDKEEDDDLTKAIKGMVVKPSDDELEETE